MKKQNIMLMNQIKKVGAVTLLGLLPLVTQAQQHIKAAFDALVQDNSVELSVEHKLEKDPETGIKESQFDFWEFTLPKSKQVLVKNIQRAFDLDREQAYSISTGSNSRGGEGVEVLAVGNGKGNGYSVGEIKALTTSTACLLTLKTLSASTVTPTCWNGKTKVTNLSGGWPLPMLPRGSIGKATASASAVGASS